MHVLRIFTAGGVFAESQGKEAQAHLSLKERLSAHPRRRLCPVSRCTFCLWGGVFSCAVSGGNGLQSLFIFFFFPCPSASFFAPLEFRFSPAPCFHPLAPCSFCQRQSFERDASISLLALSALSAPFFCLRFFFSILRLNSSFRCPQGQNISSKAPTSLLLPPPSIVLFHVSVSSLLFPLPCSCGIRDKQ